MTETDERERERRVLGGSAETGPESLWVREEQQRGASRGLASDCGLDGFGHTQEHAQELVLVPTAPRYP